MKKTLIIFLFLTLLLTSCGNETSNIFTTSLALEPSSLSPLEDVSATTKSVLRNMNDSLVRYNPQTGEIENSLATSITNQDNIYNIQIQKGLTFHNGSPLTVEDVYYSFERLAGAVEDFEGIDESWQKLMNGASVEYISDTEMNVSFNKEAVDEFSASIDYLFLDAFIVPSDYSEEAQKEFPIGIGPYKFIEYTKGDKIVFQAFDDYYGDQPQIKDVEFKIIKDANAELLAFQSGELDMIPITPENIKQISTMNNVNIIKGYANDVRALFLNMQKEPFDDINVRQAINYGIDKTRIIENTTVDGFPLNSHMSPALENYYNNQLEKYYPYDLEKAQDMMGKAGYNKENRLEVELKTVSENSIDNDIAVYIKEDLAKMFIDVEIKPEPWEVYYDDVYEGKNYDMTTLQVVGYPDPYDVISRYATDNPRNMPGFSSEEFDELVKKARKEEDENLRQEYYYQMQEILAQEAASVFIMDTGVQIAINNAYSNIDIYPFAYTDISSIE